jgi:hypothetical protein
MVYCVSCAAQAENDARFCTNCGCRLYAFDKICPVLVSQIDISRKKWFELTQEVVADLSPGQGQIVYTDFLAEKNVAISEENTLVSFPYKTLDGETLEAAIISWQVRNAMTLAMDVKSYFDMQHLQEFSKCLAKATFNNLRWNMSIACISSDAPLDGDCIAQVLAHYLLNDPRESGAVRAAQNVVVTRCIPLLHLMTCLATATAFCDAGTMREIMSKIRPG